VIADPGEKKTRALKGCPSGSLLKCEKILMTSQEDLIYGYTKRVYNYPNRSISSDPSLHFPPQRTNAVQ